MNLESKLKARNYSFFVPDQLITFLDKLKAKSVEIE